MAATGLGAWAAAAEACLEAVELTRAAGPSMAAAITTAAAAAALSLGGRQVEARPLAIRALELARSNGSPSAIVQALYAVALASGDDDPHAARAALDEAFELTIALDYENFSDLTGITFAAAAIGDWPLTARAGARVIRLLHWVNDRVYLSGVFAVTARALAETDPEAAGIVQSAARTLAASHQTASIPPGTMSGSRVGPLLTANRDTSRLITETLGEARVRALREQGAAMDIDEAVAYTLGHLEVFIRALR
jgi:hypothetical protein